MPTLLPSCMQFVEDGCTFVDLEVIPKLLEVSSDGTIECQKGFHNRPCDSNATGGHYKRVIEIKCLTDESMLSMRYSVPSTGSLVHCLLRAHHVVINSTIPGGSLE